jgi:hypothetical protein
MNILTIDDAVKDVYLNGNYYASVSTVVNQAINANATSKKYCTTFIDKFNNNVASSFDTSQVLKIINTSVENVASLNSHELSFWNIYTNSRFFLGLFTAFKLALDYRASDRKYVYRVVLPNGFYTNVTERSKLYRGKSLIDLYYSV